MQHENLMLSVTLTDCIGYLSKVVEEEAQQLLLLDGPAESSGLVVEVGGGMVRHDWKQGLLLWSLFCAVARQRTVSDVNWHPHAVTQ